MRIAQLSDFHFTRLTWNPLRLFSKRFFGTFNWLLNREKEFSEQQLESLPELFRSLEVDLILLGGDFTSTALPDEFRAARQFVETLQLPWIAIPGNHDHYTYRSYRQKHFYRHFSNPPSPHPLSLEHHGVEIHSIAPKWHLIALDTSIPTLTSSQGLFSLSLETALLEALQNLPTTDSILLLNHYPFFHCDSPKHCLQRGDALEKLIKQFPNIRAYLHGHTHRHAIADLQSNGLPLILDSGSSAHSLHGSWNLLDLSDTGCTVTAYQWKETWQPFRTEHIAWNRP